MYNLLLNDLLNLNEEEIKNSKIVLNMESYGKKYYQVWQDTGDVSYSYWSHRSQKQQNFKQGQRIFGFVRLPSNKYLLITVGDIVEVPKIPGSCKYATVSRYDGLIGRLIVKFQKGSDFGRYAYDYSHFLNKAIVEEILPKKYEVIQFKGYDSVHLKYSELRLILNSEKFLDYRNNLEKIKGVYCLTDTKEGKLYIGSAYGDSGVAQRWNNYINTNTGGNQALIKLYNVKGEEYFQDNFTFTLIEHFGMNYDTKK